MMHLMHLNVDDALKCRVHSNDVKYVFTPHSAHCFIKMGKLID